MSLPIYALVSGMLCFSSMLYTMQSAHLPLSLYELSKQALITDQTKKDMLVNYHPYKNQLQIVPNSIRCDVLKYITNTLDTNMPQFLALLPTASLADKQEIRHKNNIPLTLYLAYGKRMQLNQQQTDQLINYSGVLQELNNDIAQDFNTEIELPMLEHKKQVKTLLVYLDALTLLPHIKHKLQAVEQEVPIVRYMSVQYLKQVYKQEIYAQLQAQSVPTLCALLTASTFLDIRDRKNTATFIACATRALAHKLMQAQEYTLYKDLLTTLPVDVQRILTQELLDISNLKSELYAYYNSKHPMSGIQHKIHNTTIQSISWSPEGKYLASGSQDNIVRIWNSNNGKHLANLTGHQAAVMLVLWSPNGKYIASSSCDGTTRIWSAKNGCCIAQLPGIENPENSISWSPNSNYLASGSHDNVIRIWNIHSGQCLYELQGHQQRVTLISWSPNGKYIASTSSGNSSQDGNIKIWDTETNHLLYELQGHNGSVTSISWAPNSMHLASGSLDKTVRIWNMHNGQCLHELQGHQDWISTVSWSPDDSCLASSSSDKTLRIWDTKTGQCQGVLKGHTKRVGPVSWSPNSNYIVSGSDDKTIKVWDIHSKKCIAKIPNPQNITTEVLWSSNGRSIAINSWDNAMIVWQWANKNIEKAISTLSPVIILEHIHSLTQRQDKIETIMKLLSSTVQK